MADAAARALSLPVSDRDIDGDSPRASTSTAGWRRRSPVDAEMLDRPRTATQRWLRSARRMRNKGTTLFFSLTPLQRSLLVIVNIFLVVSLILFAIFHEKWFHAVAPGAKRWREMPGGWIILWVIMIIVSFPPMIGYSSCVLIAGFVWGMKGWFIVSTGSIVGSTLAFLASRTLLKRFVSRLTNKNKRFAALALVLKHDGLKLLIMIRLCPLPYSLSNGAISTIPTVTWYNFMLATAIVSPKLLLHVFIGSELGKLASDEKLSFTTKAISWTSIVIGMVIGGFVGYFIYVKTRARALELEAEEAAAVADGRASVEGRGEYSDDPVEREAASILRGNGAPRAAFTDDDVEHGYRDSFSNDEDAQERNVFDLGDGETDDEDIDSHL